MFRYLLISVFTLGIVFTSCEKDSDSENLDKKLFTEGDGLTDSRDGNTYKTIVINGVEWMAENLAYLPKIYTDEDNKVDDDIKKLINCMSRSESRYYVYKNYSRSLDSAKASASYSNYGVLYNWWATTDGQNVRNTSPSGVQGVCPDGWHMPSDAEWLNLQRALGNKSGYKAKSVEGWEMEGNGNNAGGVSLDAGGMLLATEYYFDTNTDLEGYDIHYTKGHFTGLKTAAGWWSTTTTEGPGKPLFNAMSWTISYNTDEIMRNNVDVATGLYVRCVKD